MFILPLMVVEFMIQVEVASHDTKAGNRSSDTISHRQSRAIQEISGCYDTPVYLWSVDALPINGRAGEQAEVSHQGNITAPLFHKFIKSYHERGRKSLVRLFVFSFDYHTPLFRALAGNTPLYARLHPFSSRFR